MSQQNLLQNVYLFKEMSPAELDKISAVARVSSHAPGDEIFTEGDQATALYVIKYGSVKIQQRSKSGNVIDVATLGTGSHFGEMAFVDSEARSASVLAIEKTDMISIDFDAFRALLDAEPVIAVRFYKALSHFLCGRLRLTTTDLSFAREKNLRHF